MRHIFKIDSGETDWVSAESDIEALDILADLYGEHSGESYRITYDATVEQMDDSAELTVTEDDPEQTKTTKTCRQWADEMTGLVASTCY